MFARQFDPAEPELMDRRQPVSPELETDLHNLRQLNRYFGSHALVAGFLRRWIKRGDELRVADLATGSGDIPRLVVDHARAVEARVHVTAVDQQGSTIEIGRRLSSGYPEITFVEDDVLSFGSSGAFDLVLCSLALHHFNEPDAIRLLRHCRDLSDRFVLVADLRRGLLTTVGIYLLTALFFRQAMTQVDGRMSARRAFGYRELRRMTEAAGWANFGHRKFRYARQAVWLERENS